MEQRLPHKAGGVLLVTHHRKHGACIVLFHNRRRLKWESPWGTYEQSHQDAIDTAAAELFEETCATVRCDRTTLAANVAAGLTVEVQLSGPGERTPWGGLLVGLRVDDLSQGHFDANHRALLALRSAARHGGTHLGSTVEMDAMTFIKLDTLEVQVPQHGHLRVEDCDGRLCDLALEKKLLFSPAVGGGACLCGLALARRTYERGPLAAAMMAGVTVPHLNHGRPLLETYTLVVLESSRLGDERGGPRAETAVHPHRSEWAPCASSPSPR